jgi:hypothetical protein
MGGIGRRTRRLIWPATAPRGKQTPQEALDRHVRVRREGNAEDPRALW